MDDDKDLGNLDPNWKGFRIINGHLWTPNGYFYRPGDIYVIPIRMQLLDEYKRQAEMPTQLLL